MGNWALVGNGKIKQKIILLGSQRGWLQGVYLNEERDRSMLLVKYILKGVSFLNLGWDCGILLN